MANEKGDGLTEEEKQRLGEISWKTRMPIDPNDPGGPLEIIKLIRNSNTNYKDSALFDHPPATKRKGCLPRFLRFLGRR